MRHISPSTTMCELAGQQITPEQWGGQACAQFFTVDVADAHGAAAVWIADPLRYHADFLGAHTWSVIAGADGCLHPQAAKLAVEVLAERLAAEAGIITTVVHAVGLETSPAGPAFAVIVHAPYTAGESFDQWLQRCGWPIMATVVNITDPGTYNSPYLYREVAQRISVHQPG